MVFTKMYAVSGNRYPTVHFYKMNCWVPVTWYFELCW